MKSLLFFLLPLLASAQADWNVRGHIPLREFVVQSHRGAGELMPENSLDAFELAWKLATVPEADLRTTSDGVIVAFHDNDFSRILPDASPAEKKRGIQDLTWSQVSQLDIGAWKGGKFKGQRVPRLDQVYQILRKNPGRRLYIDIKNVDLAQLARESGTAQVRGQLILASTDYSIIRQWKALAPDSFTLHWMGGTEADLAARVAKLREVNFADISQLQIHIRSVNGAQSPSDEFLISTGRELRAHNILFQVLPWATKDAAIYRHLLDVGAASFATDFPDTVMQIIRDYYHEKR